MKLISNWSWLLRDSTSSDAKPSLEEALQKCSDVTLWFAKSDAFGHFWTLLDTFGHFWSLEAMFDSFVRVETLLCNLAPDISRCFSSFWYLMCCKLQVLFDLLFSFSQCLLHAVVKTWCLFPSLHGRGCTFQRGWRSIRREKAWAVLWYWVVWLLWKSTAVNPAKLPSSIKGWNWSPTDLDFSGIARPPMPNPA